MCRRDYPRCLPGGYKMEIFGALWFYLSLLLFSSPLTLFWFFIPQLFKHPHDTHVQRWTRRRLETPQCRTRSTLATRPHVAAVQTILELPHNLTVVVPQAPLKSPRVRTDIHPLFWNVHVVWKTTTTSLWMPQPVTAFAVFRWTVRACSAVEFSANVDFK